MANSRSKSRTRRGRGRSRKRRPEPGAAIVDSGERAADQGVREAGPRKAGEAGPKKATKARARTHARVKRDFRDPLSVGERPQAPWHPWPLSEVLILIGGIGAVVGMARLGHGGISNGGPVLFAGLAAVVLGTLEITWREHTAGYRSHTLILALLPVVVFHSVLALGLAAFTTVPRLLNVGLLFVDAAIFATLFKLLRARFLDARARVVSRL
ncbi:MAG TPA: hypothetical protein VG053_10685 [Solirubrobacteraceae bacterium]|nr:hypothetical protein [Solirubrobacteraceae bacterium]